MTNCQIVISFELRFLKAFRVGTHTGMYVRLGNDTKKQNYRNLLVPTYLVLVGQQHASCMLKIVCLSPTGTYHTSIDARPVEGPVKHVFTSAKMLS